jgi:alpha-D-xyloside xylohydrolase
MFAYIQDRLDGDGALITRSGYTGTQGYSFDWAGDNRANFSYEDGLPTAILAAQNAALSGIALWGSDIAGYFGTPDAELFVRWAQFGAFSPLMQVHMTSNQGPWSFGEVALQIFRRFAKIRMQLFPYLYEAVQTASRSGLPIIRPMVLAFQSDRHAAAARYQYLFGPDLLVAPMYQPGTYRSVYLPEGRWIDFWDGTEYLGQQTVEVFAPLTQMPLFVRSGAILPMLPDEIDTLVPKNEIVDDRVVTIDDRRILQVWPGGEATLTTHEGLRAMTRDSAGVTTLNLASSDRRRMEVHLMHRHIDAVMLDGENHETTVEADRTVIDLGYVAKPLTVSWKREQAK